MLYRAAIRAGDAARDPEPQAWMLTQVAWVFWHDGDYAGARAGFTQALAAVPDYVPAWQGLGRVALSTGDHQAAIDHFERAQARQPLAEVAWWLGDALTASGQHARARSAYAEVERLAARADPRTLALFCATRGRHLPRAVALARRAFRERPDVYSKDVLAFALYRDGQLEESRQLARELIATGTVDARIVYHAGLILRASGHHTEGANLMARALAQNPRFDLRLTGVIDDES
jgi:tetratricopeptide (TPR) repeat protein